MCFNDYKVLLIGVRENEEIHCFRLVLRYFSKSCYCIISNTFNHFYGNSVLSSNFIPAIVTTSYISSMATFKTGII